MTTTIGGIIPALVTPFTAEERIDEPALQAHVERMITAGADAVFSGGTNGEFFAMSIDERLRALEITLTAAAGRVPVLAGTGCVTTRDTVELTRRAGELGAAAVSVISPYFAAMDQDQLAAHFSTVADASPVGVLLYNIPARTQNPVAVETVVRLSAHPQIIGVKDSSGDVDLLRGCIERTPDDFVVLAGSDGLILSCLREGGQGAITGIANVFPETMVGIHRAWRAGDEAEADRLQEAVASFRTCLQAGNPNTVVKEAVTRRGYAVGPCRRPFVGLTAAASAGLDEALAAAAALGLE